MTRQSRKTDAGKIMPILAPVLGERLAAAIIEHRDMLREPMTEYAAELQVREYVKCGDPVAAAEMQILRNWVAIKSTWFANELRKDRGYQSPAPIQRPMSEFQRRQNDIKQQLERSVYGESRDEYAGQTIDIAARDFQTH